MKDLELLQFIRAKSESKKDFFQQMEQYAAEHHIPIIKPETARFLGFFCSVQKPMRILEIGTAIGYSSMVMADALGKEVLIDTVEISVDMVKGARENIRKYGFQQCIHVIFGDAIDVLENLENPYDLIFLDGAKGQYIQLYPLCYELLSPNGVLITDNVFCRGMLLDLASIGRKKRTMVRNMNQYIDDVLEDNPLFTFIPLGDGLLMNMKKPL